MVARRIVCHDYEIAIRLVILHMRGSIAINVIFSLKWRCYGLKGVLVFWIIGETYIFFSCPIVYSCMIKSIVSWNNGKWVWNIFCRGSLIVLMGLVNDEYKTNDSNESGTYCMVLDTSVSLLLWCMIIHWIRSYYWWELYNMITVILYH